MHAFTLGILLQASLGLGATGYEAAYRQAEQEGQPLLVLVGADWCPACQVMKSETLPQMTHSGQLRGVALTIVDTDRQPRLAQRLMQGDAIPQLILYWRENGRWMRQQLTGAQSPKEVTRLLGAARKKKMPDGPSESASSLSAGRTP